jgi:hypothetical protein
VIASGTPADVLQSPMVGEAFLGSDPLALLRTGPVAGAGAGAGSE